MNIQSTSRVAIQDVAHRSNYVYGVSKELLQPRSLPQPERITLEGPGHLETSYHYATVEGWLDDMPVQFTYLVAKRSYEYTKQVFNHWDKRFATSNTNSWIV